MKDHRTISKQKLSSNSGDWSHSNNKTINEIVLHKYSLSKIDVRRAYIWQIISLLTKELTK